MHTLRMLPYTGPALPDGTTPEVVYVVGYYQPGTTELWRPWLFCVKLGEALHMVAALNGAEAPAMNLPYFNIMQPEPGQAGTFPAAVLHDFVRINWKPEDPAKATKQPDKKQPDNER